MQILHEKKHSGLQDLAQVPKAQTALRLWKLRFVVPGHSLQVEGFRGVKKTLKFHREKPKTQGFALENERLELENHTICKGKSPVKPEECQLFI